MSDRNCGCGQDPCVTYGVKKNPYNDPVSKYPRIEDMVAVINKMTVSQMRESTDIENIPLPARQSLMVFLRDWRIDDPSHDRFMKFIPKGFPVDEALMMGDLLSFAMVEGEERKKTQKDGFIRWKRWQDELQPFYKKAPNNLSITDLVGLHCTLLNMLPQYNYSQYTITQLFAEDETMLASLVGEKIKISPHEFEALTMLTKLVERGAIEQFKLAMTKGSNTSLIKLAQQRGMDIGSMILDAFKYAQQAAQFFQTGDFAMAIEKMDQLESNYQIGTSSFAEGLDQMFVATLSYFTPGAKQSEAKKKTTLSGSNEMVLMSLDTSFNPQGFPEDKNKFSGGALASSSRVREIASQPSLQIDSNGKLLYQNGTAKDGGTFGAKGVRGSDGDSLASITTDWYALFAGFVSADTVKAGSIANVGKTVFGNNGKGKPILRFVIHGYLQDGMKDLVPKGLLTVALSLMSQNTGDSNQDLGKRPHNAVFNIGIDMIYQDFAKEMSRVKDKIPTISTPFDADSDAEQAFEDLDMGVQAARKARKKPSKKKTTQGQLIAIDLTPSTQVRLSKAVDKADYMKMLNKEDADFKYIWNKYGKGNKPIKGRGKHRGKFKWRGKIYDAQKDNPNKPGAALKKAIAKEGTYADYKSGMANMRMIYAPRKDNGRMVPFRLVVPKILVRQGKDSLIAKSGSADSAKMKKLLTRLKQDFGPLVFKLKPLAVGGFDRYRSFKKAGDKQDPTTRIDRGVSLVYQAEGLPTSERFSTSAHPSGTRANGQIIYTAMTKSGQAIDMEAR